MAFVWVFSLKGWMHEYYTEAECIFMHHVVQARWTDMKWLGQDSASRSRRLKQDCLDWPDSCCNQESGPDTAVFHSPGFIFGYQVALKRSALVLFLDFLAMSDHVQQVDSDLHSLLLWKDYFTALSLQRRKWQGCIWWSLSHKIHSETIRFINYSFKFLHVLHIKSVYWCQANWVEEGSSDWS